jgi:16S rRNA processing protein RimM
MAFKLKKIIVQSKEKAFMNDKKIAIGKIIRPHGIKGAFVFFSYSGNFKLEDYPQYFMFFNDNWQEIFITHIKIYAPSRFLVTLKDITRNDLEKNYLYQEIFVDELNHNTLKQDEFYYQDLLENQIFIDEKKVGKVIGVHNFGSVDMVEVLLDDKNKHGKEHNVFLPLQEEFLVKLDLEKKEIYFQNVNHLL